MRNYLERIVIVCLCVLLAVIIGLWKPWEALSKRTVTVVGQATVVATPDEFIFSPSYQKTAPTATDAIAQVSTIGNATVTKLKALGAKDDEITTSVNSAQSYEPLPLGTNGGPGGIPTPITSSGKDFTATYSITAILHDKTIAQKALDYLVTTPLLYAVTPQSTLSKATKKKLESQARVEGSADAHTKALDTAKGLGARLGRVISVSDVNSGGGIMPLSKGAVVSSAVATTIAPTLETGTQEVTYSVTVVYHIW